MIYVVADEDAYRFVESDWPAPVAVVRLLEAWDRVAATVPVICWLGEDKSAPLHRMVPVDSFFHHESEREGPEDPAVRVPRPAVLVSEATLAEMRALPDHFTATNSLFQNPVIAPALEDRLYYVRWALLEASFGTGDAGAALLTHLRDLWAAEPRTAAWGESTLPDALLRAYDELRARRISP